LELVDPKNIPTMFTHMTAGQFAFFRGILESKKDKIPRKGSPVHAERICSESRETAGLGQASPQKAMKSPEFKIDDYSIVRDLWQTAGLILRSW